MGKSEPLIEMKDFGFEPAWKNHRQDNHRGQPEGVLPEILSAALPRWMGTFLKTFLGATVALYILNQNHLLPKPIGAVVSKALFWPTMPISVARRIGRWTTKIDDTVIMGGAPFGFANIPERLHDQGVRGVVNLCAEYQGPVGKYKKLGLNQLWLPTVDHFEPSLNDIESAVKFIQMHEVQGGKVYVHCRAGHGRSAAVVYAWLLSKDPYNTDPKTLNEYLCTLRNVRKSLWKQENIRRFHANLRRRLGKDS